MIETGRVLAVNPSVAGDELALLHVAGSTVLSVTDAADFDEDGGTVMIAETVYTYSSADPIMGTLTLGEPLVADAEEGERVEIYDPETGTLVQETIALVETEGMEENDDPLEAVVTHDLIAYLPEGIRDYGGEAVEIEYRGGRPHVVNVLGLTPRMDGSVIDPDTLPMPDTGPDGLAPEVSPTPDVKGTVGAILASWTPISNPDPVLYEVHVSPTAITPVLDGPTKVLRTAASSAVIRTLADGTPLAYDATYHVYVIALDEDGPGPASTAATGSPVQVTTADVAADYVYAGTVSASQITAGELTATLALVGSISTAAEGRRVEISNESGITVFEQNGDIVVTFPTDPDQDLQLNGDVIARTLTVLGGMEFRGTSTVASGSKIVLGGRLGGSVTPPAVKVGYPTKAVSFIDAYNISGPWHDQGTGTLSGYGYRVEGPNLVKLGVDDGGPVGYYRLPNADTQTPLSVAKGAGDVLFVLQRKSNSATNLNYWVHKYDVANWNPDMTGTVAPTLLASYTYTQPDNTNPYYNFPDTPAIGRDDTNGGFVIACQDYYADINTTRYRVRRYDANGVQTQNLLLTGVTLDEGAGDSSAYVTGVHFGSYDLGTTNYFMVASRLKAHFFTSAGARSSNHDFPFNGSVTGVSVRQGFMASFGGFSSISAGTPAYVTRYSGTTWTTETSKWWAGFTWHDSTEDSADPENLKHETSLSAVAGFTMKKRAYVTLTTPAIPTGGGKNDPNSVRFYMARASGSTEPARTAFALQTPVPADGVITATYSTFVLTPGTENPSPPAESNFPSGVPGRVEDTNGAYYFDGEGDAKVRNLEVDSFGPDSGWVSLTLTNGWTNYGGAYAPLSYRRVGNRVFLRGLVVGGTVGLSTPMATLPADARPVYDSILPAVVNNIKVNSAGDGSKTFETGLPKNSVTDHRHDVTVTYNITNTISSIATRLNITSGGAIAVADTNTNPVGWISLEGISYFVD